MDYMDGFNGQREDNSESSAAISGSAKETSGNREELNKKLRQTFDGKIVRKDLTKHIKEGANVPIYVLEYLLGQYCNSDDEVIIERGVDTVKSILANNYVRPDEAQKVLSVLRKKGSHTVIDLITVELNMKADEYEATFSNLGLTKIPISEDYPEQYDRLLCGGIWCIVQLEYGAEDDDFGAVDDYGAEQKQKKSKQKNDSPVSITKLTPIQMPNVDMNQLKEGRKAFSKDEWIDVLLGAIDYNAEGFKDKNQKLTMLTRLLPFVEERLNLMELAPKGTGKSYIFSQISKKGWLVSGGVMTRAKMFYDMNKHQDGLVSYYDYVALDEISTIKFPDIDEMRGAMKGYLEASTYNVGNKAGSGKAGVVLLGNIRQEKMDVNNNMLEELPPLFEDSALIDRFHGFIKGWDVPRMNEDMKVNSWALNTEYFSEIMHALREDVIEKALVDELIEVPKDADTRDTKAVKRIATAYMKLLFPHWKAVDDVNKEEFKTYCLDRAVEMRQIIKTQLGIMDIEYKKHPMQEFKLRGE